MIRCCILGIPTHNKWKGYIVSREAIDMAREYQADMRKEDKVLTFRQCIMFLQTEFANARKREIENAKKEVENVL